MTDPADVYDRVRAEVDRVLIGNDEVIEGLIVAMLADGHMLLEGVPGVAKTTMAKAFARVTGLDYSRVQMTPDVLPADITGTEVYRHESGEFTLRRGPVFANLVVADEINRATPKTQSALLEAMQERQVTIGGETLALPSPFMLIATQNPIEMEGVYELPEAQRDRFQFRYRMDLLDREDERRVVDRFDESPDLGPADLEQVVTPEELDAAQQVVDDVYVAGRVKEYLIDVVLATRRSEEVAHGASTRATLMLLRGAKAYAAIRGRDYVIPDDVIALVEPALAHRLVLDTEADIAGRMPEEVLEDAVESVDLPEAEFDDPGEGRSLVDDASG
jgi:MoxR-like ATPase